MSLNDRQIIIIIILSFAIGSVIIEIIRQIIGKKLDLKSVVYVAISGGTFGWALFYGYKIIEFFYLGKHESEFIPEDLVLSIVLGSLALILGSAIVFFYGMSLKELVLKEKISEKQKDLGKRKDKNIEPFQKVINQIDTLLDSKVPNNALFEEVKTTGEYLIIDKFGKDTGFYQEFIRIKYIPFISRGNLKKAERDAYEKGLGKLKGIMGACINYYHTVRK